MLLLLLINYLIFALAACYIFEGTSVSDEFENNIWGFRNFHVSMMTLFRCSTGEDWPRVMFAFGDSPGMYTAARVFFVVFVLIDTFILLNMVEMVVVQIFDDFYFEPDNALLMYETAKAEFDRTWNLFTFDNKGEKIKAIELPKFFAHLKEPLGFRVDDDEGSASIERIVLEEESFHIRKPYSSIAFTLSMNKLPM
jgi:hypothetical protein